MLIQIVVVDDHKLFRENLAELLNRHPGFRVIACCQDSEEAIEVVKKEKPDVVLMDINIKPFSGVAATHKITSTSLSKIIGLSMHSNPFYVKKMLQAGACGYVTKNSTKEEIFAAVIEVTKGNKYICSEIKFNISEHIFPNLSEKPNICALSKREIEVINCIKKGFSTKEIGDNLSISVKTVEVFRHSILKKLTLKDSDSLVNFIRKNGF